MITALRQVIGRKWKALWTGIGGVAAVVVGAGLELRDHAVTDGPVPLEFGKRVDLGPYAVTVTSAALRPLPPDAGKYTPKSPTGILWVSARVENLTSSTRNDLAEYIRAGGPDAKPTGRDGTTKLSLIRDRESSTMSMPLQPALPEDVVLTIPAPPSGKAQVTLFSATYKERDALAGLAGWYDLKPKASAVINLPKPVQP